MEHDEKPLPIDIRLLGALAEKVRPFLFIVFGYVCVCVNVMHASPSTHVFLLNFLTLLCWIFS